MLTIAYLTKFIITKAFQILSEFPSMPKRQSLLYFEMLKTKPLLGLSKISQINYLLSAIVF